MANKKEEKTKIIKPKSFEKKAKELQIKKEEPKFFARDIAEKFRVPPFDFLIIKRQNNIEDTSAISTTEFKEMYRKVIEGR
jgi:hypothetical protein